MCKDRRTTGIPLGVCLYICLDTRAEGHSLETQFGGLSRASDQE